MTIGSGWGSTAQEPDHRRLYNIATASLKAARLGKIRTLRQFVEEELIVTEGPHKGPLRVATQPWLGHWYDEAESNRWREHWVVSVPQAAKTLALISTMMYHLFELQEPVLFGLPQMEMAGEKWSLDIQPSIAASRFARYLPTRGAGSRGAQKPELIRFGNGTWLKFITAGGGAEKKAGSTARVLVLDETDKYDEANDNREADPIRLMMARVMAYGSNWRLYGACTVTTPDGRIWREYQRGSKSRIVLPCPHCHSYVLPERENLTGWESAETELQAKEHARLCCPECGGVMSEPERKAAMLRSQVVHSFDRIDAGRIVRGEPTGRSFSLRIQAANNLLMPMSEIAINHWKLAREPDEKEAEKTVRQFYWSVPWEDSQRVGADLTEAWVKQRHSPYGRGVIPAGATHVSRGVDLGQRLLHWVDVARIDNGARSVVLDFGVIEVNSGELSVGPAVIAAVKMCMDDFGKRYDGKLPGRCVIDTGWNTFNVYEACRLYRGALIPLKGQGARQYVHPRGKDKRVKMLGRHWHIVALTEERLPLLLANVDERKWELQQAIMAPLDGEDSLAFYKPADKIEEELRFKLAKHLTAERRELDFSGERGEFSTYKKLRASNHYLDATSYAMIGLEIGAPVRRFRAVAEVQATPEPAPSIQQPPPPERMARMSTGGSFRQRGNGFRRWR